MVIDASNNNRQKKTIEGHQDGKHCITTVTCTLTETECKNSRCSAPGAPGWDGHPGAGGFTPAGSFGPEDCCNACLNNPQCRAWIVLGTSCLHSTGSQCSNGPFIANSGNIRCAGGAAQCTV
ncbi:1579_t:CDS:2 [Paraglomus occultum]|uniref:1579_t:CDS:1 n=1 Tax=Paraglomus occultum TaxID=144539 RepID=A0A9N9CBY1_9GLOM|nr:1579_t:CDS:2 [Paraglomus occultum]